MLALSMLPIIGLIQGITYRMPEFDHPRSRICYALQPESWLRIRRAKRGNEKAKLPEGRGFVAQWSEHQTSRLKVWGSNPGRHLLWASKRVCQYVVFLVSCSLPFTITPRTQLVRVVARPDFIPQGLGAQARAKKQFSEFETLFFCKTRFHPRVTPQKKNEPQRGIANLTCKQ